MLNERDVLESTYFDTATIERLGDVEQPSGETKQDYAPVYRNVPCALSQADRSELNVIQSNDMLNVTKDRHKLFISPDIQVTKGDKIIVTQQSGPVTIGYASKPFYYLTHYEVELMESDK